MHCHNERLLLLFFFHLYFWNTILSEYLPAFYAICSTSNCSDDLHIVTNNGVFDEMSTTVSFKDDFYLSFETHDDHLQSSVPIWINSTQVNVSDVVQFNAFGFVKFAQHGKYYTCNMSCICPRYILELLTDIGWVSCLIDFLQ